jgi:hypothetical protein
MLILNQTGESNLKSFLNKVVDDFENQDFDAWVSHAEAVAMHTQNQDDIILEVSKLESLTGRPETLTLPLAWFQSVSITARVTACKGEQQ